MLYTANITPIAKKGSDIFIEHDYIPLDQSKQDMSAPNNSSWFRNADGIRINTNELGKKLEGLTDSQAAQMPNKRTGTMEYHSTSSTGVTSGLRSKSIFRTNSSGCSNLKFDS
jgi:hypothetical protein